MPRRRASKAVHRSGFCRRMWTRAPQPVGGQPKHGLVHGGDRAFTAGPGGAPACTVDHLSQQRLVAAQKARMVAGSRGVIRVRGEGIRPSVTESPGPGGPAVKRFMRRIAPPSAMDWRNHHAWSMHCFRSPCRPACHAITAAGAPLRFSSRIAASPENRPVRHWIRAAHVESLGRPHASKAGGTLARCARNVLVKRQRRTIPDDSCPQTRTEAVDAQQATWLRPPSMLRS